MSTIDNETENVLRVDLEVRHVHSRSVATCSSFKPGQPWPDDNGVHINAHGGGFLLHEGTYYWFGEHKVEDRIGNSAQVGVHVYSSNDLYNWADQGIALEVSEDPHSDITRGCVLERPKVIYNKTNRQFVMWFHLELKGQGYSAARSGVAVASHVTGPYRFVESFRINPGIWPQNVPQELRTALSDEEKLASAHAKLAKRPEPEYVNHQVFRRDFAIGQMARDMTLFVDDDGSAYHIYASEENAVLHISRLTDDYCRPSGKYIRAFPGRAHEAPAIFKHNGTYFMITSGCTGWEPNPARSAYSESIWGPWHEIGNPCNGPDSKLTFHSQATYVIPVAHKPGCFIYAGDRWRPNNPIDGGYVWLPLEFTNGYPVLRWRDEWDLSEFDTASRHPPRAESVHITAERVGHQDHDLRSFECDCEHFLLDGRRFVIHSGELHYFRIPREYWRHRLQCARAMGLNTVSTYMPWNLHEPRPGEFCFSGMLDVAAFLMIAQEEGLKVILRPGPYICGEWEFGGLPAWLLAIADIKLRCNDQRYVPLVRRYLARVGLECAALQHHHRGPIILVQVENEYGAFGNDRAYMDAMVSAVRDAGFDGQLFTCDWAKPANLNAGEVSGAVTVANFGSKSADQISALRKLRPNQPSMCGEFWCGWFDAWGNSRKGSPDSAPAVNEIRWMIENNTSFNFYMFHGGTSFGMTAGANYYDAYSPTVSSYDYCAPLDEAGCVTPKYHALRDLLASHQPKDRRLPAIPQPPHPLVQIPRFKLSHSASLRDNLPVPTRVPQPQPMEAFGQSYGLILYRTSIAGLKDQELRIVEPHDFAHVFLNGRLIATLDRRKHESTVTLQDVPDDIAQLDILIDTMGRVNFGPKMIDRKGITDRVEYGEMTLMDWQVFNLPLDEQQLRSLVWCDDDVAGPAFHRGRFHVEKVGETFLDLSAWSRGVVWVNGHCLSRFWNIGPQQTAYLPGAWLKPGSNDVVVFDIESPGRQSLEGLIEPILDAVRR